MPGTVLQIQRSTREIYVLMENIYIYLYTYLQDKPLFCHRDFKYVGNCRTSQTGAYIWKEENEYNKTIQINKEITGLSRTFCDLSLGSC